MRLSENLFSRDERSQRLEDYRRKLRRLLDDQDRLDGEALRATRLLVRELQDRILAGLARAAVDAETGVPWGTYWWSRLDYEARMMVGAFGRRYAVELGPWLGRAAEHGVAMASSVLDVLGVDDLIGFSPQILRTASQWSADLVVDLGAEAIEAISKEIRLSLVTGEPATRTMARLAKPLSDRSTALGSVAYQAERVTRTEVSRAHAVATQMRQEEVARTYPEIRLQRMWVCAHVLKWPCPTCSPHDGRVFDVNDRTAPEPPLHPNCRCTYVSYVPGLSQPPAPGERAETVVAGPSGVPTMRQRRESVIR